MCMLDDLQRHQSLLSSQQRLQELFLSRWNAVNGPRWSHGGEHISSLLPDDLTTEQRRTALTEMKAIPEYFYRYTGLPIISPANAIEFMQQVKSSGAPATVISLFSGSGRLLLTLMSDPHHLLGLPPIDLRHGWNIGQKQHQQLIDQLYDQFKPSVTIAEPRCKHWSKSGNRRDPVLTQSLREEELPTLRYLSKRIAAEVNTGHFGLLENPKGSAIWWDSPLASLEWHNCMRHYNTCQCHFMKGIPDGERHKKETSLLTNAKLKNSIAHCHCTQGHIQLQGTDTQNHVSRTAAAALFPYRFCQALSSDIVHNLSCKEHRSKKQHGSAVKSMGAEDVDHAARSGPHLRRHRGLKTDISESTQKMLTVRPGRGKISDITGAHKPVMVHLPLQYQPLQHSLGALRTFKPLPCASMDTTSSFRQKRKMISNDVLAVFSRLSATTSKEEELWSRSILSLRHRR